MEVAFGNGTTTPDINGAWNPFKGTREFTFVKVANIERVVVLEFCGDAPLEQLFEKLHSVAYERGIRLAGKRGMPPGRFVPLRPQVPPSLELLQPLWTRSYRAKWPWPGPDRPALHSAT